jgi:hypothetical protein
MTPPVLRPGDQLASAVCATKVVVIRVSAGRRPLIACGGSPMVPAASAPRAPSGMNAPATLIGKRHVDAAGAVELLCRRPGPAG